LIFFSEFIEQLISGNSKKSRILHYILGVLKRITGSQSNGKNLLQIFTFHANALYLVNIIACFLTGNKNKCDCYEGSKMLANPLAICVPDGKSTRMLIGMTINFKQILSSSHLAHETKLASPRELLPKTIFLPSKSQATQGDKLLNLIQDIYLNEQIKMD
jgi:hypothetical protein